MREIDLRSDTKTLPTPEMRDAMANAELGDDVAGEDPTVNRFEAMAAELLGKEAAMLVTSGTMGNLVAILTFCQRGDEIIVGEASHIYRAEGGGASALGGITYNPLISDQRGMLAPDQVESAVKAESQSYPGTRLVALENTHNAAGGIPITAEDIKSVADVAHSHDIPLHIDGARIFNAAVSLETPVAELVKDADTVTFCLSKGLSAPVGSVLCGSQKTIDKARRWRRMLGAGMRQSGIIAAAGIVALEEMISRLAEDHANARKLAIGLSEIPGIEIDPDKLPTNLLFLKITRGNSSELAKRLDERGVKVGDRGGSTWRLVTHYGITSGDIDNVLDICRDTFKEYATYPTP